MEETNVVSPSIDTTTSLKAVLTTNVSNLNDESSAKRRPAQALYKPPRRSQNLEVTSPVSIPLPPSSPITTTTSTPPPPTATPLPPSAATTSTSLPTATPLPPSATTSAPPATATLLPPSATTSTPSLTATPTTIITTTVVDDVQQSNDTIKPVKSKTTRPSLEPYVPPSRRSQTATKESNSSLPAFTPPTNENENGDGEEDEEEDWEKLLDSNDSFLDNNSVEEIQSKFKKSVQIKNPSNDYSQWSVDDIQVKEADLAHIIEVSNFPSTFRTEDLSSAFKIITRSNFDIKWVDETHALVVFPDANMALDALQMEHPMYKVCSMSQASAASKKKAKSASEFLQPYKSRPQTSSLTANRRICAALGLKNPMSSDKTKTERQKIELARQQKSRDKEEQKSVWDGGVLPATSTT